MDKRAEFSDLLGDVARADLVSFGGGGHIRKPMAAACAIASSDIEPKDYTVLLGGPELDVLVATKKVRRLEFAFMGLGPLGLLPNFRAEREAGNLDVIEASEYLVIAGLEAAARGVPFMPTKSGLGTDVLTRPNCPYREFDCPLTGERLVAVPAASIDVAIVHVNVADSRGNALIFGDAFIDPLLVRAARRVWLTAERVVDRLPSMDERPAAMLLSRIWVHGVIEAPAGGGFTEVFPDHPWDRAAAADYQQHSSDPDWMAAFAARTARICAPAVSQ